MKPILLHGDSTALLDARQLQERNAPTWFDLTFLDPPFNQSKDYDEHDDSLPEADYWKWMSEICAKVYQLTSTGGALYFMQREKNAEFVLRALRETGWTLQNLIVWKKMTSAVPGAFRFGKSFQVIAFATKGARPRVFNRLRIDPPLLANHKYERPNGVFLTDVWDDVRELTSGYFAGDEAIRRTDGERAHKQQAPIELLLRIILSSTAPGDRVLDPFAGTGTTLVVSEQLNRHAVGIERAANNIELIKERLTARRSADSIERFLKDYACTMNLHEITGAPNGVWAETTAATERGQAAHLPMFEASAGK